MRSSRATRGSPPPSAPSGEADPHHARRAHHLLRKSRLMRTPVSWIREYADLPADLATGRPRPPADRARPQARGARAARRRDHRPARGRPGADDGARAAEERQDHQLVHRRRRRRQRHRGTAGHRLRRAQLRCRRPGGRGAAGRRAAGRLRDLRPQDLRPRLGRDDLLRRRAGAGRRPRRHHRAPRRRGEPGQDARPVLGLDEEVIEFEINPDRAYALSLRGIAREAATAYAVTFTDPCARPVPAAERCRLPGTGRRQHRLPGVRGPDGHGLRPDRAVPDWLATRIRLAGMRPISLAVDVTNYVMLETGRPIHGYDGDRLQGPLVVRRASAGERLRTLDGTDRELSPEDLVVCDDSGVIGLGGVMGGEATEISDATTTVVVEAAHWDAVSMFRTGKRHRLTSEAGKRNERGVDPTICEAAADRVVELLTTYGGGTAAPGVTVVGTPPTQTRHLAARRSAGPGGRAAHRRRAGAGRAGRGRRDGRRRRRPVRHASALAARPERPLRPGRGGRPDRRLRPGAVGAPDRARRARAHPRAAAAAPDRSHPGLAGLHRGRQHAVRR